MIKMPYSTDLEERLLGCMINSDRVAQEAADDLSEDLFYQHKHQTLFKNIKTLVSKNKPVDVAILLEELRKSNGRFSVNDCEFLTDLAQKAGLSTNYEEYAQTLKELSLRRKGLTLCHGLIKDLEKGVDTEQAIDQLIRGLSGLEQKNASMRSLKEIIHEEKILEELSERQAFYQEHKRRKLPEGVINTGIAEIDNTLGGLYPSRLYILGARPGLGKTALALNISLYAAASGHGCAFFSLEMSEQELVNRYLSSFSEKKLLEIQMGCLSSDDFFEVKREVSSLQNLPIYTQVNSRFGNQCPNGSKFISNSTLKIFS